MESKQEQKFVLKQAEEQLKKKQEELKEEKPEKPAEIAKEKKAEAKEKVDKKAEKPAGKEEKKREIVLERLYTIPMKRFLIGRTKMKRHMLSSPAVRAFAAKHMKTDKSKVRLEPSITETLSRSGRNRLPIKIKVKISKDKEGKVLVQLAS